MGLAIKFKDYMYTGMLAHSVIFRVVIVMLKNNTVITGVK